jgi:hypothetical protein
MKTYIPTPEEVYDGPRMPVTEDIIASMIESLPGPGVTIHLPISRDLLRDSADWHVKKTIKEVENLFRLRGWQVNAYFLDRWWIEITNPGHHGINNSCASESSTPQQTKT